MDAQGNAWYWYVDSSATLEQLKKLTSEFLAIFDKCPSKLKKKILQSHNEVSYRTVLKLPLDLKSCKGKSR